MRWFSDSDFYASNEVGWQIQDMLRDITLRLLDFNGDLPQSFAEIMEQLGSVNQKKWRDLLANGFLHNG